MNLIGVFCWSGLRPHSPVSAFLLANAKRLCFRLSEVEEPQIDDVLGAADATQASVWVLLG
jgi:hypothetical protein